MSLQAYYTFNENDLSDVRDYSTLTKDSTSVTGYVNVAGDIGRAADLSGTTLNFGNILDFGGTNSMSIFSKFQRTAAQEHILAFKSGAFELRINAANKVVFKLFIGDAITLTSTGTVSTELYNTIGVVYDGAKMLIYIERSLDTSAVQTGNITASSNDFLIGDNGTDTARGKLEMLAVYSQGLTSANIKASHDQPGGLKMDVQDSTVFSVGDLILISPKGTVAGAQTVITGDLGSNQVLLLPTLNDTPLEGDIMKHVGNVFDTTRQFKNITQITNNSPEILIQDGAKDFSPTVFVNNRVEITKKTIAQDNIDLLKLALLGN
ncbi:MAG: hypothetical protein JKY53_15020 [Flavobacteriales bacterium]|nr:hypothetical protein [Flavobacteriales bacterium]